MPELFPPEAWLSEHDQIVHLRRGGWGGTFPVADLERWLAFYRDLRDRKGSKFAYVYGPTVRALEQIDLELRGK